MILSCCFARLAVARFCAAVCAEGKKGRMVRCGMPPPRELRSAHIQACVMLVWWCELR